MASDLFTVDYLSSYVGLVAVTYLLVQFFKEPIKKHFSDWTVRLMSVGFALVIQFFTLYVTGNMTIETLGLAILNSFLIAITAAGAHNISKTSTGITNLINSIDAITYSAQVPDVSPPIITPQPTSNSSGDPVAIDLSQK